MVAADTGTGLANIVAQDAILESRGRTVSAADPAANIVASAAVDEGTGDGQVAHNRRRPLAGVEDETAMRILLRPLALDNTDFRVATLRTHGYRSTAEIDIPIPCTEKDTVE